MRTEGEPCGRRGQQHCCCMDDSFFAMRTGDHADEGEPCGRRGQQHCCCMDDCFFSMRMLFAMRTFFAMRMEGETCEWVCLLCKDIK